MGRGPLKRLVDLSTVSSHNRMDREELVDSFLRDVRQYELLTREEEQNLFFKAQNGDMVAKEKFVGSFQRFVYAVAKRFTYGRDIMDLVEEGNIGLLRAMETYDPLSGNRFISYAIHYIRREIINFIENQKIVKNTNELRIGSKLHNIRNKFLAENGREATNEEVAEILMRDYDIQIKESGALTEVQCFSMNNTLTSDSDAMEFGDTKEINEKTSSNNGYEDEIERDYSAYKAEVLLRNLDSRSQYVIRRHFGIGCKEESLDTIANDMGVCRERVRQILKEGMDKMFEIGETKKEAKISSLNV